MLVVRALSCNGSNIPDGGRARLSGDTEIADVGN
jgi:hypothetical protein